MSGLIIIIIIFISSLFGAENLTADPIADKAIDNLEKPLYSPFVERYVLDELKQLRIDNARVKHELTQQILDREQRSVDRGVAYATDTITYFFYMIAAATSVLVLVGWSSIRDIKERVHLFANDEIASLINKYEKRLETIEDQLHRKTQHIEENREDIERTQEIQSLWLRAQQENNPSNKITAYDEILKLRGDDCEALTYKADAVLELGEPQWAANLCHQALKIDQDNSHAFYQLACAYTAMEQFDDASHHLAEALSRSENYHEDAAQDPALRALMEHEHYQAMVHDSKAKPTVSD